MLSPYLSTYMYCNTLQVNLNTMRLLVESFLLCLSLYLSLCVSFSLSLSSWIASVGSVCHELSENIWVWGSVKLGCWIIDLFRSQTNVSSSSAFMEVIYGAFMEVILSGQSLFLVGLVGVRQKYVTSMINFTGAFAGARCNMWVCRWRCCCQVHTACGCASACEFARVSEGSSRTAQVSVQG